MPWDRVQEGEGIEAVSAGFLNSAMDYLERLRMPATSGRAESSGGGRSNVVLVKNQCGKPLARMDVVRMDGLAITPESNPAAWANNIVFNAVPPTPEKAFAVLLEPLAPGAIGAAVASGVMPVRVNVKEAIHEYANPVEGETSHLESAVLGSLRILHPPAGAGVQATIGLPSFVEPILGVLTCDVPETGCNVTVKFAKLENCKVVGVGEEFEIDILPPGDEENA